MKKTLFCSVAGLLLLLMSFGTAYAQDENWSTSFTPSSVGTYVEGENIRVLVAPAGHADSGEAAKSLQTSLDEVSNISLVMDSGNLGDVSKLDDDAIVKKTTKLPVDLVAIVRVFGESPDRTAVVTFYSADGEAHSAFTATEGKPLEPKRAAPQTTGGEGISSEASEAVASSVGAAGDDRQEAIDEFAEKFVWFQDWVTVNRDTGAYMGSWSAPYRGKYREPLEGAEFYEAVDRPDLAEQYRKNSRTKRALGIPAAVLMLGGLTLGTWGIIRGVVQSSPDSTYNETTMEFEETREACFTCGNWQLWSGIGGLGVGMVLGIINGTIDLYPTTPSEARKLADQFNRSLAKELGLTDMGDRENLPIAQPNAKNWTFDLLVSPGGIGAKVQF